MRADRLQSLALRAGAVLDAAFAAAMLAAPGPSARLLRIELPADPTWFRLCGVTLAILAGAYLLGARLPPPQRHALAVVAGAGRLAGCAVLLLAFRRGEGAAFAMAGAVDGALGALHLALAAASRKA